VEPSAGVHACIACAAESIQNLVQALKGSFPSLLMMLLSE
jgi:hypothetical protein